MNITQATKLFFSLLMCLLPFVFWCLLTCPKTSSSRHWSFKKLWKRLSNLRTRFSTFPVVGNSIPSWIPEDSWRVLSCPDRSQTTLAPEATPLTSSLYSLSVTVQKTLAQDYEAKIQGSKPQFIQFQSPAPPSLSVFPQTRLVLRITLITCSRRHPRPISLPWDLGNGRNRTLNKKHRWFPCWETWERRQATRGSLL